MKHITNRAKCKKPIRTLKCIIGMLFLVAPVAYSQLENPLVAQFTVKDGLPNDNVYAVVQDAQGFLWVGTENGLARYDGKGFSTFQHDHLDPSTISSDDILCMILDRQEQIWIGTFGGGLNRLDPKEKRFERFESTPGGSEGISHSNINTLFEDKRGRLWVGTDGGGVDLFHPETNTFSHNRFGPVDQIHPRNQILSIEENYDGKLWVGTQKGLLLFDPETGKGEPYQPIHESEIDITTARIVSLYLDASTRDLWVGTHQGVYRLIQGLDRPPPMVYRAENSGRLGLTDNQVNVIFRDRMGALWVGTGSNGLNRFSLEKESFVHWRIQGVNQAHHRDVRTMFQDRTGIIWVGDRGLGLMKIDRKPSKFLVYRQGEGSYGLSHPFVKAVLADSSDNLWVGTEDGLNYINRLKQTVSRYHYVEGIPESLPSDEVNALGWWEDNLVVGTSKGLRFMENGMFMTFPQEQGAPDVFVSGHITSLLLLNPSSLWIGSEKGMASYNGRAFTYFQADPGNRDSLPAPYVTALGRDDKGSVWIGLKDKGLARHRPGSDRFEHFAADPNKIQSLSNNTIHHIHYFLEFIWVGTPGGLNRVNGDARRFLRYTKKDGLPGNTIYAIADDGRQELWVSTNQGLCRMDPFEERFRSYDVVDGLQGNRFSPGSVFKGRDNELFFGGVNGLNTFFPKYVKDNPFAPKVAISRVQVPTLGETLDFSNRDRLELSHLDKVIHFEFRALDFTLPEKNAFRVMMDPFDKEWTTPASQKITYASLPPGPYVFRVKASNNDGIWSNANAEFHIRIHPPFYQTVYAYTFYGVLILAFCLGFVKYFRNRERREANRRIAETSEQMKKEAHHAKQVFLAHMSHELRTPLTAVIGYTELVEEEIAELDLPRQEQIRPDLEKIKASAFYQLALVSNLLELSKLEAGQNDLSMTTFDVASEIRGMLPNFEPQLAENRNSFKLRIPHEVGSIHTDRIKLLEIVMNLLTNANKYTRDGEITLMIRRLITYRESKRGQREWVTFVVKDTGVGMTEEEIAQILDGLRNPLGRRKTKGPGLGLELCYRFTRMMNGEIDLDSEKGAGTRVTLRIPAGIDESTT